MTAYLHHPEEEEIQYEGIYVQEHREKGYNKLSGVSGVLFAFSDASGEPYMLKIERIFSSKGDSGIKITNIEGDKMMNTSALQSTGGTEQVIVTGKNGHAWELGR